MLHHPDRPLEDARHVLRVAGDVARAAGQGENRVDDGAAQSVGAAAALFVFC